MTEESIQNEPGAASDNSPGGAPAGAAPGSNGADETWVSGLQDADNRAVVEAKGWAKLPSKDDAFNQALKSYRSLEQRQNDLLKGPGPEATAEDWEKYHAQRGRPETPEGYNLKLPDGLPADLPYDSDFATKFKTWAHKTGATPREAQQLHDEYVREQAANWATIQQAEVAKVEKAHQEILKSWGGDETSETYRRNTELANRAIRQGGGEALMQEVVDFGLAARGKDGALIMKAPRFAQMLATMGEALYSEDRLYSSTGAVDNPWLDASENLAKQGDLVRNDPQRAKALIAAAGKRPEDYFRS